MTPRARIWLAARLLITLGLLGSVFFHSGLRAGLAGLQLPASPGWLIPAWLCAGLCEATGILRLRACLQLAGLPLPWKPLILLHLAGLFTSLFLPGTAGGDGLKFAFLLLQFPRQKMHLFLALLLDRLAGFMVLAAWIGLVTLTRGDWLAAHGFAHTTAKTILVLTGPPAAGLAAWFLISRTHWMRTRLTTFPFRQHILRCESAFDVLAARPVLTILVFLSSILSFTTHFLVFHFTAAAYKTAPALADSFSALPLIDIITLLPVTIAGIGLREQAFQQLFAPLCGLEPGQAVIISITGFLLSSSWALPGALALTSLRTSKKPPHV